MANNPFGKLPAGLGDLMKSLPKAMADAKQAEADLAEARVTAQAGGGAVKVTMTGKGDLLEIKIAQSAVDPEDVETLEDLVTVAVRDAIEQANKIREDRLKSIMPGGMGANLPGLF